MPLGMAGRFIVDEITYLHAYAIGWYEDGECDAHLGQSKADGQGPEPTEREDWEWWKASKVCIELKAPRTGHGAMQAFTFDSHRAALAALKRIKLELAQERPLPDWATKALAEGWKPPKGWKA
jgi:hypothetical protein